MTPAKRRPATPASQGPTRTAPDVPIVANPPSVPPPPTPGGVRAPDVLVTAPVPPADTTPPTETGQGDAEDRATSQSPGRSGGMYPLPVWPD